MPVGSNTPGAASSAVDFEAFWEVWGGFGKGLGGFGDRFGRVLEGFGEGLGKVWGRATSQNEARPADRAQRLNNKSLVKNKYKCSEHAADTCAK